jgi:Domain of unknown function (DUF4260)
MKSILKLEELVMFFISVYVLYYFDAAWWLYLLLLLGPDISMLGYLAGDKIGAWSYNLFHHKGIAIALIAAGFMIDNDALIIIGVILFGHASMDRVAGYGLKYENGFKFTHLGEIGKK